jgi:hypothetical protein
MKKRIAGLFLVTVLSFGAVSAAAQASYHEIRNFGSQLCAGLNSNEYYYNGATVVQQPCNGSPEQMWAPDPSGSGYYRFINGRNGKCMDVRDGIDADRTPVQVWTCTATRGMSWRPPFLPAWVPVQLKSGLSGARCLDVRGAHTNPARSSRSTTNNPAQQWTIHP